jgi:hypothetical protein
MSGVTAGSDRRFPPFQSFADGFRSHSSPDRVEAGGSEGEVLEPGNGPYLVERLLPISDAGPTVPHQECTRRARASRLRVRARPGCAFWVPEATAARLRQHRVSHDGRHCHNDFIGFVDLFLGAIDTLDARDDPASTAVRPGNRD